MDDAPISPATYKYRYHVSPFIFEVAGSSQILTTRTHSSFCHQICIPSFLHLLRYSTLDYQLPGSHVFKQYLFQLYYPTNHGLS